MKLDYPYLPDWCQGAVACQYEGHEYGDGGACVRCGERLRCVCGQFFRVDGFEEHIPRCPTALRLDRLDG